MTLKYEIPTEVWMLSQVVGFAVQHTQAQSILHVHTHSPTHFERC